MHDITKSMEAGNQVDIVLLDFTKALDKVPHQRLLHKLNFYGVRNNTLKWIESFLKHRSQKVVVVLGAPHSKPQDVYTLLPKN